MQHHTLTTEPTTDRLQALPDTVPGMGRPAWIRRRLVVVAGAAVSALVLWVAAGPALGIDLDVLRAPGATTPVSVTAGSVLVASVTAGLLGWGLLTLLERLTARGATIWRWVAGVAAVLSLSGPLTLAQSGGGTVVLTLLHVVVAAVLLLALPGARTRAVAR